MTAKILDVLRALLLEIAIVVGFYALWFHAPTVLESVGQRLRDDRDFWRWVLVAPTAILGFELTQVRQVLFPVKASDAKRPLTKWPEYWRLRLRVGLALFWTLAAQLADGVIWLYVSDISARTAGTVALCALAVSITAAGSLFWASLDVRQLTER